MDSNDAQKHCSIQRQQFRNFPLLAKQGLDARAWTPPSEVYTAPTCRAKCAANAHCKGYSVHGEYPASWTYPRYNRSGLISTGVCHLHTEGCVDSDGIGTADTNGWLSHQPPLPRTDELDGRLRVRLL